MTPALEGAPNFRDLAGYAIADGRLLQPGRLLRSQGLHALTDADLETLRALDVRLVCDLRGEHERRLHPSRWPQGMQTHQMKLDVDADIRGGNRDLVDMIRAQPGAAGARAMMIATYGRFPERFARPLARFFSHLMSADARTALPALVHCSVGKDRTGFMIAILLSALGVAPEVIYRDYLETERFVDREYRVRITEQAIGALHGFVPDRAALEVIASVESAFLDAAFAGVNAQFGSVANYLSSACALDPVSRRRFLDAMTEPWPRSGHP
jgi:protein-tyrosine phosphatase